MSNLLEGKLALVLGIANRWSLAYAVAQAYAREQAKRLLDGAFPIDKFVMSRSLRSEYKNPEAIKHKMLADRANERGSDSFRSNDRVHFVHVVRKAPPRGQKLLQGERIETPDFVARNRLKVDYRFYLTNQVEKPIAQMLALGLEALDGYSPSKHRFRDLEAKIAALDARTGVVPDATADVAGFVAHHNRRAELKKLRDKLAEKRQDAAREATFGQMLRLYDARLAGNRDISTFFKPVDRSTDRPVDG